MDELLPFLASIPGLLLGTLLVSRVGSWVQTMAIDRTPIAVLLHSGPWLLAATIYSAWYLLRSPHTPAWDWFFGGGGAAILIWIPALIFLARRRRTP